MREDGRASEEEGESVEMKSIINKIIAGHHDTSDAFGCESPSERRVVNKMLDELLCLLRVWDKKDHDIFNWEWDALKYLAAEYQEEEATLTATVADFMRAKGLLPNS